MYHSASFTPIKFIKLINLECTVVLIVQQNYPINPHGKYFSIRACTILMFGYDPLDILNNISKNKKS